MKKINITESQIKRIIRSVLRESQEIDRNYTHFAVNRETQKIVNGWDYSGYDPKDLRDDKKYYFYQDLVDYELNPTEYRIYTKKFLERKGIDPFDTNNWANS